jgi:hypothetical protein
MNDDTLAEFEGHVPGAHRGRFREIVAITDGFCASHLNDEYRDLCRELAVACCQSDSPALSGKAQGWAAGVVYSIGWVNFVTDPSQEPHVKAEQIARGCGSSSATMHAKSKVIREGLGLISLDPDWTLPSRLADNPYVWMLPTTDGLIIDIRRAPRDVQEDALRQGLIPYIPDDHADDQDADDGNGDGDAR